MEAFSLPNLNRETTSYHNFFTFFEDPNHHDDTTLHKRPKIDHSQVSEPSETSPFKDILSPLVSFNGSNENHYPVGGYFDEWDQNQMDQTLPKLPPSPTRSSDTNDSVGSNPFSGNVGARSEGPNFTQLRWDQTPPNTSSIGSDQLSGNVGARSEGLTSNSIDDGHTWRKYGQKVILNYNYPRRPTSLHDRTRDSDDDDSDDDDYQDSDDDVAASANNLSRAIRYGIYGNDDIDEAHGSLEQDDQDVYFDDESAEVVISSLRLGDDLESGSLFVNSNWFAFGDDQTDEKINLSK